MVEQEKREGKHFFLFLISQAEQLGIEFKANDNKEIFGVFAFKLKLQVPGNSNKESASDL